MARTLDQLLARNADWARRKTAGDSRFFSRMAEQQTPKYLWIGCSDSRVTANDVLELDPGQVFVHRNIANVVHTSDLNILSVLEFAVEHLKVEHIIVCGHYGCGGIERVFAKRRGALFDHWLQPVSMLYRKHQAVFDALPPPARLNRMCEINIEMQVRRLAATPIVENAWARKQELHLHGWIYRIDSGLLGDLGPHLSSIAERDGMLSIDERINRSFSALSSSQSQAAAPFAPSHEHGCCYAEGRRT